MPIDSTDQFLWLEEVEGERALDWVRLQNERSLAQLTRDPRYQRYYDTALAIAQDKSRIPLGPLHEGWIYNFWQDETNVRGVWRRTPLDSYQTAMPQWQMLLDVDALAKREESNWVFKGAYCLPPASRRCLIQLSNGGKDASVLREFDVEARDFVKDGFFIPEAKSAPLWVDENTLLVATDWGPGSLTRAGYPFVVKQWSRGTPLAAAREIHRGQADDFNAGPGSLEGSDGQRFLFIHEGDTFTTGTYRLLGPKGELARMTLPLKTSLRALHRGELVFSIEEDWDIGGRLWKSGALLSMPVAQMTSAAPTVREIVTPGARDFISSVAATKGGVLVASYSNIRGRLLRFVFDGSHWRGERIALPDHGTVELSAVEPTSATALVTFQDFLRPNTLFAVDVTASSTEVIKSLPQKFDGSRYIVEQFEASSRDGTQVPYFLVRPKKFTANGEAPTLLRAYGGFQVALRPNYSAINGQLWLEQGGVYVLANIRGGGEFGPAWHQAGLKTRRQVVYDDFIAVAEDLIRRKISSERRLGIAGGSNGGLLMGVMLAQRPELFRAVVLSAPLLDMLRYHQLSAGASWIDEYGSPDVPAERAFLEKVSPYHTFVKRSDCPEPLFFTSTKDDRVHPAHARKFAAKMESLGLPYLYYENTDGGHSAAANLREHAKRSALEFTYLAQRLMD